MRSAITIGPDKDGWLAYFSDRGGNVHAVDVVRGEALWTTHVADHPAAMLTGSPMLAGTTLFVPIASREEVTATTRTILAATSAAASSRCKHQRERCCGRATRSPRSPRRA